jgi:2-iminoacetate synthase ThiH
LLFASYIAHNVIRKKKRKREMWSKEINISYDTHLLNELLETGDAIVMKADKLRKRWDSVSEMCSSLCERRLENSEACAIACKDCAFYSVFPSGMASHSKIAQFN